MFILKHFLVISTIFVLISCGGNDNKSSPKPVVSSSAANSSIPTQQALRIDVLSDGGVYWSPKLVQSLSLGLTIGKEYRVSFRAKASSPKTIWPQLNLGEDNNYKAYVFAKSVTTDWQEFSFSVTAEESDTSVIFGIDLGTNGIYTVMVDDISVTDAVGGHEQITNGNITSTLDWVAETNGSNGLAEISLVHEDTIIAGTSSSSVTSSSESHSEISSSAETSSSSSSVTSSANTFSSTPSNCMASTSSTSNNKILKIDVTQIGDPTKNWEPQVGQTIAEIRQGQTYKLSIRAKASIPRTIFFSVNDGPPNYVSLPGYATSTLFLSTEWQTFDQIFTVNQPDDTEEVKIQINLGAQDLSTVWVDNVSFTKSDCSGEQVHNGDIVDAADWTIQENGGAATVTVVDDI
jgi:Carbohydrate binding domain